MYLFNRRIQPILGSVKVITTALAMMGLTACGGSKDTNSQEDLSVQKTQQMAGFIKPYQTNLPLQKLTINDSEPISTFIHHARLALAGVDIFHRTRLHHTFLQPLQITQKSQRLGLTGYSVQTLINDAPKNIDDILTQNEPSIHRTIIFKGTKTSELNKQLMANSRIIISQPLLVDKTIQLHQNNLIIECRNQGGFFSLSNDKLNTVKQLQRPNNSVVNQSISTIHVQGINHRIEGCQFEGTQAIIAEKSVGLKVSKITVKNSPGYGIIFGEDNRQAVVSDSQFDHNYASAIAILARNQNLLIANNHIDHGQGYSNFHAGILVSDRSRSNIGETDFLLEDGHYPIAQAMSKKIPASHIYIVNNHSTNHKSSGIYIDGATNTYIRGNHIEGNAKEGLCLDNGTLASFVYGNRIEKNGNRWGQTDYALERDFVLKFGRMSDGSAKAKLPGISIDNTMFNLILENDINHNYGSGIKMVRTAFNNTIAKNRINDNNQGKNDVFFFFGIELGGATADADSEELDFTPSMGNLLYDNHINGQHYAGIQFCSLCADNDIVANQIINPTAWSIEQTDIHTKNHFAKNTSNVHARNAPITHIDVPSSSIWEKEINAFEVQDKQHMPPTGSYLFVGSSTIRLWQTQQDFSKYSTINRGFGGSQLVDLNIYVNRIITKYHPKAIFVYSGENDLEQGKSPDMVRYDFQELVRNIRHQLPNTPIYYIAIKPSPARWQLEKQFLTTNQAIKAYTETVENVDYIDVHHQFLDASGKPDFKLYQADRLHLNQSGYAILNKAIYPYLPSYQR